ncbi:MAG: 50S ribosomal protein L21 [Candidatus Omnitrophota bacterium]
MYAIVELGAKQYVVKKDDVINVEKFEAEKGREIMLDKVLLVSDEDKVNVGQPFLKDAKVKAMVLGQTKSVKTIVYRYRRRKSSHNKKGHRQQLTKIKIGEIAIG